jgi:hypothetical protein
MDKEVITLRKIRLSGGLLVTLIVLTSCNKVEVTPVERAKDVTDTPTKLVEFINTENTSNLEDLIENPQSFVDFLLDSENVSREINSITETESLVSIDEDGNLLNEIEISSEDIKKDALRSNLLFRFKYNTINSLDTNNNTLVSQRTLVGELNYAVLQEYSNGQQLLVTFTSGDKIEAIDVFSPVEDRKAKVHYDEDAINIQYQDDLTASLYKALTSSEEDYVNNLCYLNIDKELLLKLSKTYQRFSIIDGYKSDDCIIFIDSYEDKNTLIKCLLNEEGVLIGVDIYE